MEIRKKNEPKFRLNPGLKLMDQVCEVLRYHHDADRTEQTSGQWFLRDLHDGGGETLRHSGATHRLKHGVNIRVLQAWLGQAEVKTTEMDTHVMTRDIRPCQRPLDR